MEDNGQNEVGNRFKKGCFFETISLFEVQTVPFLNAELVPLFAGLRELGETTHEETRVLFIASGNLDQPFTMCSSMHSNVWISFNKNVVREVVLQASLFCDLRLVYCLREMIYVCENPGCR